jgi:hypothetical protein
MDSLYKVQCYTYSLAKELAGDKRNVSLLGEQGNPPFCLRMVKEHRTPKAQAFRDQVASVVRENRKAKKEIIFYHRGFIERGAKYKWVEGFSSNSDNDLMLYPWQTKSECRREAKALGLKCRFQY